MSKLDETNELIEDILESAQTVGLAPLQETIKNVLLADIAKSLAIIADSMNKEE